MLSEEAMTYPYLLISDTHYHAWQQFATVDAAGVNSRLSLALEETRRAVNVAKEEGAKRLIHAGDMFHVRGQLTPTVLNATLATYYHIQNHRGLYLNIIAGNHDLEGKIGTMMGNASTPISQFGLIAADVHMRDDGVVLIPWRADLSQLKKELESLTKSPDASGTDVIIHAPVNNVIPGIPDSGLDPAYLASLGFKRIFCGHYHNHKELVPGKVWSIGALTHQTWSDVGSKAGFMIVYEDRVQWHASHAPSFVDIDASVPEEEVPLVVDGNYVRAKLKLEKESEVTELREYLEKCGALGVVIHAQKDATITVRGSTISASMTLEAAVSDFIKKKGYPQQAAIEALCADILAKTKVTA